MERMCQFSLLSLKYGVCVFYFSSLKFKMSPILSFCLLSLTFFISMWSRIQIWGTKIEPKLYFRDKKDVVQVLFFFVLFLQSMVSWTYCTLCTWFVFFLDVYFLYTQVTPLFFLIYLYYLQKKSLSSIYIHEISIRFYFSPELNKSGWKDKMLNILNCWGRK